VWIDHEELHRSLPRRNISLRYFVIADELCIVDSRRSLSSACFCLRSGIVAPNATRKEVSARPARGQLGKGGVVGSRETNTRAKKTKGRRNFLPVSNIPCRSIGCHDQQSDLTSLLEITLRHTSRRKEADEDSPGAGGCIWGFPSRIRGSLSKSRREPPRSGRCQPH
jgi:hypothetical protein